MFAIFWLINTVLDIYIWFLIIHVVLSWLTTFGIINNQQPFVQTVSHFLYAVIEPAARPVRNAIGKFLPSLRGIDLSILALFILVKFIQIFINTTILPIFL